MSDDPSTSEPPPVDSPSSPTPPSSPPLDSLPHVNSAPSDSTDQREDSSPSVPEVASDSTPEVELAEPEQVEQIEEPDSDQTPLQSSSATFQQLQQIEEMQEGSEISGKDREVEVEQDNGESTLAQDNAVSDQEGAFEDVTLSRAPSVAPEDSRPANEVATENPSEIGQLPSSSSTSTLPQSTEPTEVPSIPQPTETPSSVPTPSTSHAATPSIASVSSPKLESQPTNRRESQASITTVSAPGSTHLVSGILIVSSLEVIAATKEAKKSKPLKDAVDQALEMLKHGPTSTPVGATTATVDPYLVFLPLRLACETKSLPLMITALDCLGKLVSYDFFVEDKSALDRPLMPDTGLRDDDNESTTGASMLNIDQLPLADQITSTVCDCFSPSPAGTAASTSTSSSSSSTASQPTTQHDTLLLRLLSCLLSLILSSSLPVHQSALLKAVRTVYNVFLLGRAGTVQTVAQATLGQIVGGVFGRVKLGVPKEISEAVEVGLGVQGVAMPRSASRTDLESVKEEEKVDGDREEEEEETKTETEEPVVEAKDEMESTNAEVNEETGEQEEGKTPRVSVSQEDEKPRLSNGEKITTCVQTDSLASLTILTFH